MNKLKTALSLTAIIGTFFFANPMQKIYSFEGFSPSYCYAEEASSKSKNRKDEVIDQILKSKAEITTEQEKKDFGKLSLEDKLTINKLKELNADYVAWRDKKIGEGRKLDFQDYKGIVAGKIFNPILHYVQDHNPELMRSLLPILKAELSQQALKAEVSQQALESKIKEYFLDKGLYFDIRSTLSSEGVIISADLYPIKSIKTVSADLFGYTVKGKKVIEVGDNILSQNDKFLPNYVDDETVIIEYDFSKTMTRLVKEGSRQNKSVPRNNYDFRDKFLYAAFHGKDKQSLNTLSKKYKKSVLAHEMAHGIYEKKHGADKGVVGHSRGELFSQMVRIAVAEDEIALISAARICESAESPQYKESIQRLLSYLASDMIEHPDRYPNMKFDIKSVKTDNYKIFTELYRITPYQIRKAATEIIVDNFPEMVLGIR